MTPVPSPLTTYDRPLRVLVADDHPLMLEGIRRALHATGEVEVVAETNSGAQVLSLIHGTDPDVALLDIRMPGGDGLSCLDQIKKRYPKLAVVMMSVFSDPDHIQAAFKRGAAGYIVKSVNPRDLASALRQALEGTVFHAIGRSDSSHEAAPSAGGLTERELAILKAVASGLSNQAIGKELWVTEQTVKFHLTNIYRKLKVANRTEATRYAYKHGLIETIHP
jgi:DNA-binding NarL/FixJ family response regulator